ncbi:MAG: FAD-dependent oxidoreductase [Candidatus Taylorbacteria bacterium]|nr:FAD-dependent oxidoreductase [Candidatus Taylorbacteria bacterium]
MLYDLAILGGGPAGVAAGVYAARKKLKTILIAKEIGGQSIVSENIQNWIGIPSIPGVELAKALKKHLMEYAGDVLTVKENEQVITLEKQDDKFIVATDKASYETRSILIATGSRRRKLPATGADKFENKGLTYCASCDGPLFADMDVAVIGGGNAAFESAAQLLAYCKSVTLLHRSADFRADKITVDKTLANPKLKLITNAEILEITGDKFLDGLRYKDIKTGKESRLDVQGIFVEIGAIPATDFAKNLVEINQFGQVVTDPAKQTTSQKGVWAAGDCTTGLYHQNNIAMGDSIKALEDIYMWLHATKN